MAVIALVDDNLQVCRLLDRLLSQTGHAMVCLTGIEGIDQTLKQARPDLLILDMDLGGHNGLDLLRILRQEPSLQDLPVVILSGNTDPAVQAEAFHLGALDYIVKGLDWETMLSRIERLLPGT